MLNKNNVKCINFFAGSCSSRRYGLDCARAFIVLNDGFSFRAVSVWSTAYFCSYAEKGCEVRSKIFLECQRCFIGVLKTVVNLFLKPSLIRNLI